MPSLSPKKGAAGGFRADPWSLGGETNLFPVVLDYRRPA